MDRLLTGLATEFDTTFVPVSGRVAEVRGWVGRAHVAIVPAFEGSGTRLRIIEAMMLGRPLVSTRLGAEGLPISSPKHHLGRRGLGRLRGCTVGGRPQVLRR
jgi:polysaccharide biosynthesis protein PslH